jgi:tetratricopeptide (TPR) repeat protein
MRLQPRAAADTIALRGAQGARRAILALGWAYICAAILCACTSSSPTRADLAKEYAALGDAYFELKRYDKAEEAYRRAADLDPLLAVNSYQLARTYAESAQYDKALTILQDLDKRDSGNILVLNLKAYVLLRQGKADEAAQAYQRVLELTPYSLDALFNAGIVDRMRGDHAKAVERFESILERKPDDVQAMRLLAESYFELGKDERALELMEAYTAIKSEDAEAFRLLASQRAERREYAAALEALSRYLTLTSGDGPAWFERARLELMAAKDEEAALSSFRKAMEAGYKDSDRARLLIDLVSERNQKAFLDLLPEDMRREGGVNGEGKVGTEGDQAGEDAAPAAGP